MRLSSVPAVRLLVPEAPIIETGNIIRARLSTYSNPRVETSITALLQTKSPCLLHAPLPGCCPEAVDRSRGMAIRTPHFDISHCSRLCP